MELSVDDMYLAREGAAWVIRTKDRKWIRSWTYYRDKAYGNQKAALAAAEKALPEARRIWREHRAHQDAVAARRFYGREDKKKG